MSTPASASNSDSESEIESIPSADSSFTPDSLATANPSSPPLVCLFRFAGDSAAGALMGSIFGYGNHLLLLPVYYHLLVFLSSAGKCNVVMCRRFLTVIGN